VVANHDWTYAIVTEAAMAGHPGFADHWRAVAASAARARRWCQRYHRDLLEGCLGIRPYSYAQKLAAAAESAPSAAIDPELLYYQGALFADCALRPAAQRMLQAAIDQHYCAYSNLLLDPMLRYLRTDPGFDKLLKSAKEYQNRIFGLSEQSPR